MLQELSLADTKSAAQGLITLTPYELSSEEDL